jgi:polyhydroxybutyrate depolymerase
MIHTTLFTTLFLLTTIMLHAQQTINGSIMHDGLQRTYILYVPASYSPSESAPLVLNFHGYTSAALEQMFYGDFRPVADTAGFLVVHPQGTLDQVGNAHWNVGWGLSSVDDVGFTEALIDSLSAEYNINDERIYSTGMSNGGFFSYLLACSLSDRIAAVASVTGSMSLNQISSCNPGHPMPVMEIHGTADETVPYEGNFLFAPIVDVVDFWAEENNTNSTPVITAVPDINQTDNSTAEHQLFASGDNGSTVEHYKVINGGHTWPGAVVDIGVTNHDFEASEKIWQFFAKYDINGLITISSTGSADIDPIRVYPNPAEESFTINAPGQSNMAYTVHSIAGDALLTGRMIADQQTVSIASLPTGLYVLSFQNERVKIYKQ